MCFAGRLMWSHAAALGGGGPSNSFLSRVLAQYRSDGWISYCAVLQETSGAQVNLKWHFSRAGCNYI